MNLYLHIPFCRQACHYCNFHFSTSLRYRQEMVDALKTELVSRKNYIPGEEVETIYFGGGTPSLLAASEINELLGVIHLNFDVIDNAEITLESNPDDISEASLQSWKEARINRLSIGVQSFNDEELRWMNRAHNASQASTSLTLAKKYFDNITADLIYGIPGTGKENWEMNVRKMIDSGVPHLSCYALTVEEKTPLARQIGSGISSAPLPGEQSEQFLQLMDWLREAGYEHYEISNFAKPGFRSRHNSAYWAVGPTGAGKKYLGIGPSAHSFDGSSRQWNVSNNQRYIRAIHAGEIPAEKEILSNDQQMNEFVMTSLRTREGIALGLLDPSEKERLTRSSRAYEKKGLLRVDEQSIVLTDEGKLFADGIAAALFK